MSDDAERFAAVEAQIADKAATGERVPFMYGVVTPPTDLVPAVMALSSRGFERLKELTRGRAVEAKDLAEVADWEREVRGQYE